MTSFRERNNIASKKSYEKALENKYALEYEYEIIRQHRLLPNTEVWHWSNIPEDYLYEAGYITDYNKHRLERLISKKEFTPGINRLKDFGVDGLARVKQDDGSYIFSALQAKYYISRNVTASDIGSFLVVQMSLNIKDNRSKGYLYTASKLQHDLNGFIMNPSFPIQHVLHSWTHPDKRQITDTIQKIKECNLPLRPYQVESINNLKNKEGINALHIPCRMGKTLIAGHILKHKKPSIIIAIAPLKISVKNLQDRLECFIPDYKKLIVDSDIEGTTDESIIINFLKDNTNIIIYTTYKSFINILYNIFIIEDNQDIINSTFILADEIHNASDVECNIINKFHNGLVMSATYPDNLNIDINEKIYVPFSLGINEGYLVDYSIWLPQFTYIDNHASIDIDIPSNFSEYSSDLTAKALYLAVVMLKTGSRRCIAYMSNIEECDTFNKILASVFEEYHGLDIWVNKIDSTIEHIDREKILNNFQNENDNVYHIITSVRILDEAIDVPRCDSIFIGNVSENGSSIRFMQRCMRSSTIDPRNPNKHNNIILWTDEWDKCIDILELLRESDPEYNKKIKITSTIYNKQGSKENNIQILSEIDKFNKWDTIRCINSWEKRRLEWIEFRNNNNKNPSQMSNDKYERQLAKWQGTQRNNYKNNEKYMTLERIRLLEEETPGWVWKNI